MDTLPLADLEILENLLDVDIVRLKAELDDCPVSGSFSSDVWY